MSGEKRQQNHREREMYYPSNPESGQRMSQDLSAADRMRIVSHYLSVFKGDREDAVAQTARKFSVLPVTVRLLAAAYGSGKDMGGEL